MCRINFTCTFTAIAMILLLVAVSPAAVHVSYQGRLTDSGGNPVADGDYSITFSLWDDSTAGVMQWSESHSPVAVKDGLFSVVLGKSGTLEESFFEIDPLFLQIQIGYDNIITPRTRMASAPSAATARSVSGDIETGEGYLGLSAPDGSTAVTISTEGKGSPRIFECTIPILLSQTRSWYN